MAKLLTARFLGNREAHRATCSAIAAGNPFLLISGQNDFDLDWVCHDADRPQLDQATLAARYKKQEREQHHETSDHYARVVFTLCPHHRVVVCKDNIQWIVQQRKKGGAERPWRGVGYFRTRDALTRLCVSLCSRIDPCTMAALAALPEFFGGAR